MTETSGCIGEKSAFPFWSLVSQSIGHGRDARDKHNILADQRYHIFFFHLQEGYVCDGRQGMSTGDEIVERLLDRLWRWTKPR